MSGLRSDVWLEEGDPLPPSIINELSVQSHLAVQRWRRGHLPDGTHNDLLIPHAFGILIHAGGGVYNVAIAEGLDSHTTVAAGIVEITLTDPMESSSRWVLAAWAHHRPSAAPLKAYPSPAPIGGVGNSKTVGSCDVRIVEWNTGALVDHSFTFAAYGIRDL